jgi:glutaminyl-tRNA synthetase
VIKDPETGEITELRCSYDAETLGKPPEGRRVKGVIHWVSAAESLAAEVRLYDRLFLQEDPDDVEEGKHYTDSLNPDSLQVLTGCRVEPSLREAGPGDRVQFERVGYFCVDAIDSRPDALVFNKTVSLRDSWAKIERSQQSAK